MEKLIEANHIITDGTSFVKMYVKSTYSKLVELLGEPTELNLSDLDKTKARWVFVVPSSNFDKLKVLTIYDYKSEYPLNEINRWHVSAKNLSQTEVLKELSKLKIAKKSVIIKYLA